VTMPGPLQADAGASPPDSGGGPRDAAPATPPPPRPLHCAAFAECGGDLVGSWDYTSSCTEDVLGERKDCPEAYLAIKQMVAGTTVFEPDGRFHDEGLIYGTHELHLPRSCTEVATCAGLTAVIRQNLSAIYTDGTCAGEDQCTCTLILRSQPFAHAGSYRTIANRLLENGADQGQYCVKGNTLDIKAPPARGANVLLTLTRK
jgi:hypothetical protein